MRLNLERRNRSTSRTGLWTALTALSLMACSSDEGPIVDVEGVTWVLAGYDLDDAGSFFFKEQSCSTAVRMSYVDGAHMFMARNTTLAGVNDNSCDASATDFVCRCFAYSYDGDTQAWLEYAPGATPPAGVSSDTEGATTVTLREEGTFNGRFLFQPLPDGVLSSNGETSVYLFDQKANTLAAETGCEALCLPASE